MENLRPLNPPVVESKTTAQVSTNALAISFLMNRSVGWEVFDYISLILKTVQSNTLIATMYCPKSSLIFENGKYTGCFNKSTASETFDLKIGQYYKVQIAYGRGDPANKDIGFYSNVTTFKFTSAPTVSIEKLNLGEINRHLYTYTGSYTNSSDASEKVYSYEFNLYNDANVLVATSGEKLHNSSLDTELTISTDTWNTEYGLEKEKSYILVYKIKTVNGLEYSSPSYRIIDRSTEESKIFDYCKFTAIPNQDNAYVELSLQPLPPDNPFETRSRYISGSFVLLRASSEDSYSTWNELTRFVLASHKVSEPKFICRDYCVSQGVFYKYALQAYNKKGLYSAREENGEPIFIDFEDMFLTDKDRQLRIRFNPKVASFKETILETKIDTLGSKYPFFFRNGNVGYKEFPISGLISMIMDPEEEFLQGIQITNPFRRHTPGDLSDNRMVTTNLTGDVFRLEREFKMEVLKWLSNGEPKLFRSPGEGSFIVRLMNISLTPNDTLGRMLHTFNCTAYEIADYNFNNLRKFGMMTDEYTEMRELDFDTIMLNELEEESHGAVTGLSACIVIVKAAPNTEFRYKLKNSLTDYETISVGATGVYTFPKEVLANNELLEIRPPEQAEKEKGVAYWPPGSTVNYATYRAEGLTNFSLIDSISITDQIRRLFGKNQNEVDNLIENKKLIKSIGQVYYLNISKRPIIPFVDRVELTADGWYRFFIGDTPYSTVSPEEIICCKDIPTNTIYYYDGKTRRRIGTENDMNFTFRLRKNEDLIDLEGVVTTGKIVPIEGSDPMREVGGRIVLTNVQNVDELFLGNGLFADIAYQEINKTYTIETVNGPIKDYKEAWEQTKLQDDWEKYYTALENYLKGVEGDLIIDAI